LENVNLPFEEHEVIEASPPPSPSWSEWTSFPSPHFLVPLNLLIPWCLHLRVLQEWLFRVNQAQV